MNKITPTILFSQVLTDLFNLDGFFKPESVPEYFGPDTTYTPHHDGGEFRMDVTNGNPAWVQIMLENFSRHNPTINHTAIACKSDLGVHYDLNRNPTNTTIVLGEDPLLVYIDVDWFSNVMENTRNYSIHMIHLSEYMRRAFAKCSNDVASKHRLSSFAFKGHVYREMFQTAMKNCIEDCKTKPRNLVDIRCTMNRTYMQYVRRSTTWNAEMVTVTKPIELK